MSSTLQLACRRRSANNTTSGKWMNANQQLAPSQVKYMKKKIELIEPLIAVQAHKLQLQIKSKTPNNNNNNIHN